MHKRPSAVVVGTGFIGPVHVEGLQRAGVHVRGMVGSSREKSAQAAECWGLPRVYTDLAEVLADDEVTAVHLATPNRLHFEQAVAVLRAGKHVLCEKPLAMNSRESAELVRLAEASRLAAGVAYNIRFYPLCHEAAARIATGDVGDVLHVSGSYVQDWLLLPTDFNAYHNYSRLFKDAVRVLAPHIQDNGIDEILVRQLPEWDLDRICRDIRAPRIVRVGADRTLHPSTSPRSNG